MSGYYKAEINSSRKRTDADLARLGCRVLMKDGVPLLPGVKAAPPPKEEPKCRKLVTSRNELDEVNARTYEYIKRRRRHK
jgi:hypothetical protein